MKLHCLTLEVAGMVQKGLLFDIFIVYSAKSLLHRSCFGIYNVLLQGIYLLVIIGVGDRGLGGCSPPNT